MKSLGGNAKNLVKVKTSVKYQMKYIKLTPKPSFYHILQLTLTNLEMLGVKPEVSHGIFFV